MTMKNLLLILALAIGSGALGYWIATSREAPPAPQAAAPAERKILYWYDPMVPNQHFDKPGKSPFMDMDLVPKYADEGGDEGTITIDPRITQNLGVRTAMAMRGKLEASLTTTGSIAIDERRIEVVQSRAEGWLEVLHVRAVNEAVKRGQLLAEVYAPELLLAQQEFLLARKAKDAALMQAATERLKLLGISGQQITRLQKSGEAARRVAYYAPFDGIVTEIGVREGAQVGMGQALFRLADLSRVWVAAEIPESQAALARPGAGASATVGTETFEGEVEYVYPDVTPQTRTVKARIALDNPKGVLKPGMFARVTFAATAREALLVPSEALIRTGARTVVIVAEGEGRFRPVEVKAGAESGGQTEIVEGLEEHAMVVSSGQFLIDSEANLRGALSRMTAPEAQAPEQPADSHEHDHHGHTP
jgi:Cu(I)/Ag(I) efflux system membrane fusion protein